MERIGYWMNVADATSLALMCIKHKDSPSLSSVYFGMMFVLSSKIVDLKFNLTESLLDCVSSSECNLIFELRVFQVISQDKFCVLIPKILPRLQRDRSLKILQELGNFTEYTPLQVKKALTGNGKAQKEQVAFMVKRLLGIKGEIKPLDITDAIAIAITHAQRLKLQK